MASSVFRRVVLVTGLAAAVVAPGSAAAESKKVLVLPFEGDLEPGAPDDGLAQLTAVVARSSGLTGAEVNVGQASFSDIATLVGCATPDAECLGKVAASLKVDQVVVGVVEASAGDAAPDGAEAPPASVTVKLKLFRDGKVTDRTLHLAAPSFQAVLEGVARDAPTLFVGARDSSVETGPDAGPEGGDSGGPKPTPEKKPLPPPEKATPPAPQPDARMQQPPPRDSGGFDAGRVHIAAWIAAGAGVAMGAGGAVFLTMAHSRQSDVDGAPTSTAADLEHLQDLEDEGEQFTRIGDALLIGGAAALAVGGGLIIFQGLSGGGENETAVSIAPVPLPGGAGINVSLGGL